MSSHFTLKWPDNAPISQFSIQFMQGMLDRMAMSYAKYGDVAAAYPNKVNAIQSMQLRLTKYIETGNMEYLIDAANFMMIEFMHPSQANARYNPEDKSPGRVWRGEVNPLHDKNIPERKD